MIHTNLPIYLASSSPRRKKLLSQLGIKFKTIRVDFNEQIEAAEPPSKIVKSIAYHKLKCAAEIISNGIIITADTIVTLDKQILGKPKNSSEAKLMLRKLSGRSHYVYTGFAVYNLRTSKKIVDCEKTKVTFRKLTTSEINEYVAGGSPLDKAGAYGIQDDFGAVFISKIVGCYYNVVGLPLSKLYYSLIKITSDD